MTIQYADTARRDLHAVYEFIAYTLQRPDRAETVSVDIMREIRSLTSFTKRYQRYQKEPWLSMDVRYTEADKYLIFYMFHEQTKTVRIIRILYGGSDVEHQLEETVDWDYLN